VFAEDRYFDVFVEYAKDGIDDLHVRIEVHNRGPDAAELHLLPTLWFRNTWSWNGGKRPSIRQAAPGVAVAEHESEGTYHLRAEGAPEVLFTENETNHKPLFGGAKPGCVKDGMNDYLVPGSRWVAQDPAGRQGAA